MVRAAYRKSPYPVVFYERYSLRSLTTREWQRVTIFAAHITGPTLQADENENARRCADNYKIDKEFVEVRQ